MTLSAERAAWQRQFFPRLRVAWWPKSIGLTAFMTLFFIGYFAVLNHPIFPVRLMPTTALDHWIPFFPHALVLYISLWVYVPMPAMLMTEWRDMKVYCWSVGILCVLGLAIFLLWPTAIPRPDIDWDQYPGFFFLKRVDAAGNACPSLHVTFAVLTAFWADYVFRQMRGEAEAFAKKPLGAFHWTTTVNWLWCIGIVWSTIAIRQHVAVDALAGAALGVIGAWIPLRYLRQFEMTA